MGLDRLREHVGGDRLASAVQRSQPSGELRLD
jgi:hypothetical protein